ncbi:cell division protein FtsQ/DivIB [Fructilactobacillus vespulae]
MLKKVLPLLVIFVSVLLFFSYQASSYSKVNQILFTQKDQTVVNNFPVKKGDSIEMVKKNQKRIENFLKEKNPKIKSVNLVWKKHNQLNVNVKFFDFNAYLEKDHQFYPFYINGRQDNQAENVNTLNNVVILKGFDDSNEMKNILEKYEKLPSSTKKLINTIEKQNSKYETGKLKISLKDGNQVLLKTSQITTKMGYYLGIKETLKRKSLINLEYGAYSTPIQ